MKSEIHHSRRTFVLAAAGAAVTAPLIMTRFARATDARDLQLASLDAALTELNLLTQAGALDSSAVWTWAQTLTHCAQSIEYSMAGFPEARSALFQSTIGAAAYGVFAWRGRMSHDLVEPIPGAPSLDGVNDGVAAEARLRAAILAFQQWSGELQPHFAYGELNKQEYELAHAMHLANHFAQFSVKAA